MRVKLLSLLVMLFGIRAIADVPQLSATSVTWHEVTGSCSTEPHTTFCLVMPPAIFLHTPTKNVHSVTHEWLKHHPDAKLIRVCSMTNREKDPQAIFTFVWVVDGEDNLNVELVRQGCFSMLTQAVDQKDLQIPQEDYVAFIKRLIPASQYADQHKLGVFNHATSHD